MHAPPTGFFCCVTTHRTYSTSVGGDALPRPKFGIDKGYSAYSSAILIPVAQASTPLAASPNDLMIRALIVFLQPGVEGDQDTEDINSLLNDKFCWEEQLKY
ncbi:hypothetical protein C8R46DRAFT_1039634 [Mycena filopes]|nr:hypothetical protein C8R46DRAFT_1039634 [Mycena filopes]